jgi:hypothetical protein
MIKRDGNMDTLMPPPSEFAKKRNPYTRDDLTIREGARGINLIPGKLALERLTVRTPGENKSRNSISRFTSTASIPS